MRGVGWGDYSGNSSMYFSSDLVIKVKLESENAIEQITCRSQENVAVPNIKKSFFHNNFNSNRRIARKFNYNYLT